jgi:hypothetical protein
MSHDVLGVFYRHRDDGRLYAHVFGDDVVVDTQYRGAVMFRVVSEAPPISGVTMTALGNKVIVLESQTGHNLSEEF